MDVDLNEDVDTTLVCEDVLDSVKCFRKWVTGNKKDNHFQVKNGRFELRMGEGYDQFNRHDAAYAIQNIRAASKEHCQMTMLELYGPNFSDKAVGVVCDYLQDPTALLPALELKGFSPEHLGQLLNALHSNKSVEELRVALSEGPGSPMAELLRHKTDFKVLSFSYCQFSFVSHLLPFLRTRESRSLRKLMFRGCDIDDGEIQSIMDAMVEGNHDERLEVLNFGGNQFTSRGLESLCQLSRFSRLKKLVVSDNGELLKNQERNQHFIQAVLAPGRKSALEELHIARCSDSSEDYIPFITACEEPEEASGEEEHKVKLKILDASLVDRQRKSELLYKQLVESMPKIKALRHLVASRQLFALFDAPQDESSKKSIRKNTSILQFSTRSHYADTTTPTRARFLSSIAERNDLWMKVDALLKHAQSPASTTDGGSIPWALVLEKAGKCSEGAPLIYKILRSRLATWVVEQAKHTKESKSKKRRHSDTTQESQTFSATPQVNVKKNRTLLPKSTTTHDDSATTTTTTVNDGNDGQDESTNCSSARMYIDDDKTLANLNRDELIEKIKQQACTIAQHEATIAEQATLIAKKFRGGEK